MSVVSPQRLDTVDRASRTTSSNRRALGLGLLAIAGSATVLVAIAQHPVTVTLWLTAMVGAAVAFSKFEESFDVDSEQFVHRNWFRTIVLRKSEIVTVETPDHEGPVRAVLLADSKGNAISIPLSALRTNPILANAISQLEPR